MRFRTQLMINKMNDGGSHMGPKATNFYAHHHRSRWVKCHVKKTDEKEILFSTSLKLALNSRQNFKF